MDAKWVMDIEKARRYRVRAERDLSMAGVVEKARAEAAKRARAVGVGAAWEEALPREWAGKCGVVGVVRGVLTVRACDGGVRYAVDRWLRGGGERLVVERCPVGVGRVRVVV